MFTASPSLAGRFTWLFDGLCKAIGVDAQRRRVEAALAWAIWNRVRVLGDRLIALAERVRVGRLPRRTRSKGTPHPGFGPLHGPNPQGEREKFPHPSPPPQERERGRAGLLEKAPEAGKILRPLCHLLGVKTPAFLQRGAVVAQEVPAPIAAEVSTSPPADVVVVEAPATSEAAVASPQAEPPPQSGRSAAEEAALAYARRPGGLYFNGKRMAWS